MMRSAPPTGFVGKALALVASLVLLVVGFMFSVVLLAVIAVGGLLAWGYVWWKTRALRRAMREPERPADGQVIEGEAIIVEEYRTSERRYLPGDDNRR